MTEEERKERRRASRKKYEDANKEKVTAYRREWQRKKREENREEYLEKLRAYHAARKDKAKVYNEKYRAEHKEEILECSRKYRATKRGRAVALAGAYAAKDRRKGYCTENIINAEWIENNIFNGQTCYYCGESDWTKLGVDRIDNSRGHTPDNCICACWECNNERKKKSVEEFVAIKKKEKGGE